MSDSFLQLQESSLASLFAEWKNQCRIVVQFAPHKTMCFMGAEVGRHLGSCSQRWPQCLVVSDRRKELNKCLLNKWMRTKWDKVCEDTLKCHRYYFNLLFSHVSRQCPFNFFFYHYGHHHLCSLGAKLMKAKKGIRRYWKFLGLLFHFWNSAWSLNHTMILTVSESGDRGAAFSLNQQPNSICHGKGPLWGQVLC